LPIAHDHVAVVFGALELRIGFELPAPLAIGQRALGQVDVGAGDGLPHVGGAETEMIERGRLHRHAHRRQGAAADRHLADAFDLRDALRQHAVGDVVELGPGSPPRT
jgi:hypothetical protein